MSRRTARLGEFARTSKSKAPYNDQSAIIYVHGIGRQLPKDELKRAWDIALFGRDMGSRSRVVYWSDILHSNLEPERKRKDTTHGAGIQELLKDAGIPASTEKKAQHFALGMFQELGFTPDSKGKRVLPLPRFLRRPITRAFLELLVKDAAAYFFRKDVRQEIQDRWLGVLRSSGNSPVIIAHSLGSVIALEGLAGKVGRQGNDIRHFITIGSPLGILEIQDSLQCALEVPRQVRAWDNFSDPLDPVALDKGLSNDFTPIGVISDQLVVNTHTARITTPNPHAALGYLAHPKVRAVVHNAIRFDSHARLLVARDVAAEMVHQVRQPVLIEMLEPGYPALDEDDLDMSRREQKEGNKLSLASRIDRAALQIEGIVPLNEREEARIDRHRRFVSARLTPEEIAIVTKDYRDYSVYAIWRNSRKRKLIHRSGRVVQADAAHTSYKALGERIRWAVLDTGIRANHPHFRAHGNVEAVWDCTNPGPPIRIAIDSDRDGHGTHVAGIIAGESPDGKFTGVAPKAKLVVYKVLDDDGNGEDAWIIKALDHIAQLNEQSSGVHIHGLNLSLGGTYDATVYGCGFSPICMELRRLWRSGVLICVASGNEGQVAVNTPDGQLDLNSPMSIGDPANLEDCIAVGSVNADRPTLYGVSSFSSRGPTSDGRLKPDVVAPGERIVSCNSSFRKKQDWYCALSGTSMAVPHVSGLLAAFLSVRSEFCGRPDEVKEILLRTCTDIGRDRFHQGHGIPNLMKMLLES